MRSGKGMSCFKNIRSIDECGEGKECDLTRHMK